MKKILLSLLIIISLFLVTGCGEKKEEKPVDNKGNNNKVVTNNNAVVLYFSATGTTKGIAEKIANELNSDIIEIVPEQEYKSEDLNYNSDCRANREQNDDNARPKIKNTIDISKYDTIYLGYPIWWGTIPKIILTLLDSYDFSNKTIIPFCTSGSTGISGSVSDLRKYNSKLDIKDGKRFSGSSSNQEIKDFIALYNTNNSKVVDSVKVIINNKEYKLNLENNETVKELVKMLPLNINMSELNGNEKYYILDKSLPTNSYKPNKINAGDVMLYGDDCLVIFYKSFDTQYSYTKVGHIDNLPDLGNKNIDVKIEID